MTFLDLFKKLDVTDKDLVSTQATKDVRSGVEFSVCPNDSVVIVEYGDGTDLEDDAERLFKCVYASKYDIKYDGTVSGIASIDVKPSNVKILRPFDLIYWVRGKHSAMAILNNNSFSVESKT